MARLPLSMHAEHRRSPIAAPRVAAALASVLVVVAVLLTLLYSGYLSYTEFTPERVQLPRDEPIVDDSGRRVEYGRSWIARRGKLWHLYLAGTPEEMGAAQGRLAARLFRRLDTQVGRFLDLRYHNWLDAWSESMRLLWDYHGADAALRRSDRIELSALAAALPRGVVESDRVNTYHRLFLHQCFLDLARRLVEDVLVEGNMFAVAARPATGGREPARLIVGRTLTVDLGDAFEADRMVTIHRPDGKYPFASVGWPGLVGVVTGINARGIVAAINPARTDDPEESGVPWPLVLRQVLEEADTLDQAIQIIRHVPLRTAGIVLLGDGPARRAVVMEASPRADGSRRLLRGEDDSVVWATNHLLREQFDRDAQNHRIKISTASGIRYERLGELLTAPGAFDQARALSILRDRQGANSTELGLGNRTAIENLLSSQAVIIDATSMVMWVGEGPSALGRFRSFDLRQLLARDGREVAPLEDLPADPLLYAEEYTDYVEAQRQLEYATYLLHSGQSEAARGAARIALALAPELADLHRVLGDIERELGERERAVQYYHRYVELVPGRMREQQRVRGVIEELGG
ncbi:MAG: C45 family peptidase [Nannocystaceae bacterium]